MEKLGPSSNTPLSAPIPGESLTIEKGKYPYERPSDMTDANEILDYIFKKLVHRAITFKVLAALDAGAPATEMARVILMSGAAQGLWPAHTALLVAPALTVIIVRMAERANIKPRMSYKEPPVKNGMPSEILKNARKQFSVATLDAVAGEVARGARELNPNKPGKLLSAKMGLGVPIGKLRGII